MCHKNNHIVTDGLISNILLWNTVMLTVVQLTYTGIRGKALFITIYFITSTLWNRLQIMIVLVLYLRNIVNICLHVVHLVDLLV